MSEQLFEIAEIAARMRVSPRTVYRHIAAGRLIPTNVASRGRPRLRISETNYRRFVDRQEIRESA